jgi:hypothetical protein
VCPVAVGIFCLVVVSPPAAWRVDTLSAAGQQAGGLLTREEALRGVYPGAIVETQQVFLTPPQQRRAAELAGVPVSSALIARYLARQDGIVIGRAYVDTHVVRTKHESLLVSLDSNGRVLRIDVTAFLEPPEYLAPETWRRQYADKTLGNDLQLQRAIRPLAGATLSARAANEAVRRVLAIDQVLEDVPAPPERGRG